MPPTRPPLAAELAADALSEVPGSARFVYAVLRWCGPCTYRDLQEVTHYSRSGLTDAINALRDQGAVIESPSSERGSHMEFRADPGPLRPNSC